MSKTAERHLALMIRAIKLDLAGRYPGAPKPVLSPEARECLREGDWTGVAVAYLHEMIEGRRVSIGKEALRHLLDWAETPDVNRQRYVQDLIVRLNEATPRLLAEAEAMERPLNRAERRQGGA